MRRGRILAATAAISLSLATLATATGASTAASDQSVASDQTTAKTSYVVLADEGASAKTLAAKLRASGVTVTSVNEPIGLVTVTSTKAGFATTTRGLTNVAGVARDRSIGQAPGDALPGVHPSEKVEKEGELAKTRGKSVKPAKRSAGDPLDSQLWGMEMIKAFRAHRIDRGNHRVTVGVLDTGIQADHPDLRSNFNRRLSRNFTHDMPDVDGPCEFVSCHDPKGWDDNGHGTHVAGTIGAALNGMGVSGVAPKVGLVQLRGGQDSGYFFLGPVAHALTYAGDRGIDVVNMSFYVDPWLYNCIGGAPEDTPEQAAEQEVVIEAMTRALEYAHEHDVTLVGSLGNSHEDLANPRHDFSSPDYPADAAHERTIDNDTCFDLPIEGPHVLGTSALGPSGKKSDFSNYTTDVGSGEIEFSAPGGWFRDGFGTDTFSTLENEILSAAPTHLLQAAGLVDAEENVTPDGAAAGIQKSCNSRGDCGFYRWLQGTSMASPHASGVAALAVSAHGHGDGRRGLTWSPHRVERLMSRTAIDHACPPGGVQEYLQEGRDAEYTATCNGTTEFNGFYGAGIVNALGVVR